MTFNDLNLDSSLVEGINAMGFKNLTPIQELAMPIILQNKDIIACAQTGTGKTAAYILPIIHKIITAESDSINTIVIAPTRELAIQIDEAIQGFAYFAPVSSIAIYGGTDGVSFEKERKALTEGANIIIATPGRLIAHLNLDYVQVSQLQHLILDEADRMLDMGFSHDILKIISYLPKNRQTLLFSATMPSKIRDLAAKILTNPEQVNISISKPAEGVEQGSYVVYKGQKSDLLKHLLKDQTAKSILVFSSRKETVKQLERDFLRMGFAVAAIHSDLAQDERNEVLRQYRAKKIQTLIATDILSRGIDIDSIGLVINYDVPSDGEDYVHRVGRTARAETKGVAITFISEEDQHKFGKIEDLIGYEVNKLVLPEALGTGPEYAPNKKRSAPSNTKKRFFRPKRK